MELAVAGERLQVTVIVVGTLTTEGILGLDVHKRYGATIDLSNRTLMFTKSGRELPLREKETPQEEPMVSLTETIFIPPYSEVEVTASESRTVGNGTWLLRGIMSGPPRTTVANALVDPKTGRVPVRLINPGPGSLKVYGGTRVAILEEVDLPNSTENTTIAEV